jgi:thioredoxin-related protein
LTPRAASLLYPSRALGVCLVVLLLSGHTAVFAAGPPSQDWYLDLEEARLLARQTDRPILVDLYADWCGWCDQLDRKVFSNGRFQQFADHFVLLRVDIDDDGAGSRLAQRFGVESLPTTLLVDSELTLIGRVAGYAEVDSYIGKIEGELSAYRAFEKRYARETRSDDPEVLEALAEELHHRRDGPRAAELYQRVLEHDELPGDERAWLAYRLADALRLGHRPEQALTALDRAAGELSAAGAPSPELTERISLLRSRIAEQQGRCADARALLEEFLASHPRSTFLQAARRHLQVLRSGPDPRSCG